MKSKDMLIWIGVYAILGLVAGLIALALALSPIWGTVPVLLVLVLIGLEVTA